MVVLSVYIPTSRASVSPLLWQKIQSRDLHKIKYRSKPGKEQAPTLCKGDTQ